MASQESKRGEIRIAMEQFLTCLMVFHVILAIGGTICCDIYLWKLSIQDFRESGERENLILTIFITIISVEAIVLMGVAAGTAIGRLHE